MKSTSFSQVPRVALECDYDKERFAGRLKTIAKRAFWRSYFEVWALSSLTQREYCERRVKNFGNWRAQLKREDAVGPKARWGVSAAKTYD
jgi:hypothetical protein